MSYSSSHSRVRLVQEFLKAGEHLANLFRRAQIGNRIGERVVIPKPQQRREFVLIQRLDADVNVMLQDEFQEHSLLRSEEHTSEIQSLMRISYAVFCLKKKNKQQSHFTLYDAQL